MRNSTLCAVAGLLACAAASRANPTVEMRLGTVNSQSGIVKVVGRLGGSRSLTGVMAILQFDPAKVAVADSLSSATAAPGWTTWAFSASGNRAIWIGTNDSSTYNDSDEIVSIQLSFLSSTASSVVLSKNSQVSDERFVTFYPNTDQSMTITPRPAVTAQRIALGAPCHTGVSIVDSVVYAGTDDGRLHAYNLLNGKPVSGFPVDISAAVGQPVAISSRPAVYYGKTGQAIYLTTDKGHVVRVQPNGKVTWTIRPLPGYTNSTPAVTPDGSVYVNLGLEDTPNNLMNYVFRLDEVDGRALYLSPYLGASTSASPTDRSPAVDSRYAYVNAAGDIHGGLVILNQDNLMPRAEFAPNEDAFPPFVVGKSLFLSTRPGHVYELNSVTFAPISTFGQNGMLNIGEPLSTSPFAGPDGTMYVGTTRGRIFAFNGTNGSPTLFYDTKSAQPVSTLVVGGGVLAFGTEGGAFATVPLTDLTGAKSESVSGAVNPGMVYDAPDLAHVFTTVTGDLYVRPQQ